MKPKNTSIFFPAKSFSVTRLPLASVSVNGPPISAFPLDAMMPPGGS